MATELHCCCGGRRICPGGGLRNDFIGVAAKLEYCVRRRDLRSQCQRYQGELSEYVTHGAVSLKSKKPVNITLGQCAHQCINTLLTRAHGVLFRKPSVGGPELAIMPADCRAGGRPRLLSSGILRALPIEALVASARCVAICPPIAVVSVMG